MRPVATGPRFLLRRLREMMAEPIRAQDRLDKIVKQIASDMVAEVCSVYVLRSDGVLELFATEGLKAEAVHTAGLKIGEGLVGLIASTATPLSLSDAQSHPAFAYLPETGEEIYNAFLGVPILRNGQTLGVLVVQNRSHRVYTEEEMDALQTITMIIAEMIAGGELENLSKVALQLDTDKAAHLSGIAFADGIGLGHVVLHEPRVVVTQMVAEDPNDEIHRLDKALEGLRISVDDMLSRRDVAGGGEHKEVLEAYRMFAYDRGWVRHMEEAINNGLTAEAAVQKVQSDTRARMARQADPYLRDRMHDFDDLAYRLLRELLGKSHGGVAEDMPSDGIIVGRNMGAADLLDYDRERIRGLVLEEGGPTSHVAIVARALGIPCVGQAEEILSRVENGDEIIVDGDTGSVHIRPPSDVEASYAERVRYRAKRQESYRELNDLPSRSKDDVPVKLGLNAGLFADMERLEETNADGIGLFRTELQFMIATQFPRLDEQKAFYSSILKKAGDKPVTFRILDVGSDKVLPYLHMAQEENPAMGWRAIRLGLDRPAILKLQIRALLHAAADSELRFMVPMVTEVSELREVRKVMGEEISHLSRHGHRVPNRIEFGAMLEVPAMLWQLDELFEVVDFASVGSNDLFQFLTACDRGNTKLSNRYDQLSKHYLHALKMIVEAGNRKGKKVTLCGEMGGKPISALALMGLGYRSLSMNASSIGPVKAALLATNIEQLELEVQAFFANPEEHSLAQRLNAFVAKNGIPL